MNEITKCITVDLQRRGSTRLIFARQNDMLSRRLLIALTAGGVAYPVPQGTQALLNILRADGESSAFSADVTEEGNIAVTLSLWMLSAAGETRCSVSLIDSDGKKLTSDDFTLDVLETLYDGSEIAEDENHSVLTDLMADMAEIREAELARAEAEQERALAEEKREEAVQSAIESLGSVMGLAKNVVIEDEDGHYAARNVEEAFEEIGDRFVDVDDKLDALSDTCEALCGKGGSLILAKEDFDAEISAVVTVPGLGEYDMVSFGPATAVDQRMAVDCGLYTVSPTKREKVTFRAASLPAGDIELIYFIVRGSV